MSRRFKIWIAVFSLNFAPAAAFGDVDCSIQSHPSCPSTVTAPAPAPTQAPAATQARGQTRNRATTPARRTNNRRTARQRAAAPARQRPQAQRTPAPARSQETVAPQALVETSPAPTPAPTPSPVPPARVYQPTLKHQEARESILNFEAVIEGADPFNRARLYGRVYRECRQHFVIKNTKTDRVGCANGAIGFTIEDQNGLGRECMRRNRGADCSPSHDSPLACVSISSDPNATLDLGEFGDVPVTLVHQDLNRDRDQNQCEDFATPLRHVGRATLDAARARTIEERRAAEIRRDANAIATCRNSTDQLGLAREAAGRQASRGLLAEGELERILRDLDRAELNLLARRAERASIEELPLIEEELLAWASAHCDDAERVAPIFHRIALRHAGVSSNPRQQQSASQTEGFDLAAETIGRAQSIECLGDTSRTRLANYQRDIAVGRCSALAGQGLQANFLFGPCYTNLMMGIQNDVMSACSGRGASLETCSSAMTALRATAGLPQRAAQVDQQRFQMQQQIQQALSQASGQGLPMLPNASPGMPGMSPGFQSPLPVGGSSTYWAGGAFGAPAGGIGGGFY